MANYQIAVFVGSLRKNSFNHKLTVATEKLAPPEFKFKHVEIDDLPLFSHDEEKTTPCVGNTPEIRNSRGTRPAFCDAGVQPFGARGAEERD